MNYEEQTKLFCDKIGIPTPITYAAKEKMFERMFRIGWLSQLEFDQAMDELKATYSEPLKKMGVQIP